MPSIFDWLNPTPQSASLGGSPILGGADPIVPSILDTKAYRNQQIQDTLLGMSKALIQAGAPSPYPRGFADAFGAAGAGAAEGASAGEDRYLKRAMVDSQVQAQRAEMARGEETRKMLRDAFGTAPGPQTAAVAPTASGSAGGGPSNPTNPGNLADGKGGFQTFPTPEAGVAAAVKLAKTYQDANGGQPITLAQIEQKWAPPDNGKDPMTRGNVAGAWAKNVATYMGVDPNTPLDFNDPKVALAFAPAVHAHEHGPGKAYQPNVYQAGVTQAYGGQPAASGPPVALASAPPAMPAAAGPQGMAFGAPPPPTPPVQVAGGPVASLPPVPAPALGPQGGPVGGGEPTADGSGTPLQPPTPLQPTPVQYQPPQAPAAPQAPAGPVAAPQVASTLRGVVQNLTPAEQSLLLTMKPDDITKFLMSKAAPDKMAVLDTTTNSVVFVDKTDKAIGSRYQPVQGAELLVSMRNAASQERQAAAAEKGAVAREKNVESEIINRPMQPGATPGAPPVASPGVPQAAAAIEAAKETAKVGPALLKYQGEEAIKDHQLAQHAASAARTSNANLDRLQVLLERVSTGKGTETINDIKAAAKAVGMDLTAMGITDNVGPVQAAKALTAKMTLDLGSAPDGGLKGSFSDKDVAFLKSGIPGLDTTPEGRALMVDYMKRVNQRAIDVAGIKNDYMRSPQFTTDPAGMWAKVKEYADAHPLFDKEEDKLAAARGSSAGVPAPPAGFRVIK